MGFFMPMKLRTLPRSFYLRSTLAVARDLPGLYLCRRWRKRIMTGKIVEVEAYLGARDPASHTYRGQTPRNSAMFLEGGHLYVYFTYGMHFCANVVTGPEGTGTAVLLRALEPVEGTELMARNRSLPLRSGAAMKNLCSGPAKLCQAVRIRRGENGTDLCGDRIWLAEGHARTEPLGRSKRIGISSGTEFPWRYFLRGNPFVSR